MSEARGRIGGEVSVGRNCAAELRANIGSQNEARGRIGGEVSGGRTCAAELRANRTSQ